MRKQQLSALVYVRLSRDLYGAGLGVARQREECLEFCARQGWDVVEVFEDNDISATSGQRRDGFERALKAVEEGVADVIVAWHQDRLLRLSKDLERVIALDVPIHTVTGGAFDLTTPAGRAVAKTVAAWSQYETEQKALRQKAANRQHAHMGKRFAGGTRVFGWGDDRVTLDPVESVAVRTAIVDATSGASLNSIARRWNDDENLVPPRGGKKWTAASVRSILLRESNAGLVTYQGERLSGVTGEWQPIVTLEEFESCVAVLTDPRRRTTTNPRLKHFLSGMTTCGICQAPMRVGTASVKRRGSVERHQVFRCTTSESHSSRSAEPITKAVEEAVLERLSEEDAQDLFSAAPTSAHQRRVLQEIERVRSRLVDSEHDYANGNLSIGEFRSVTDHLNDQLRQLQEQISEANAAQIPERIRRVTPGDVRTVWTSLSAQEKRLVADVLISVTIYPTTHPEFGSLPYGALVAWR